MAHYSNRHFFRQTPNHYLALYFDAKGIDVDTDINALKGNDVDALQGILNPLEDALTASIEADFQGINALAREGGINALVDEARFHGDDAFIEVMAAIDGFHAKAFYAFLNKRSYWQGAARFLHADNVSASYWKKRNDLPPTPPHVEDEDIDALAKAISAFFYHKEGRGKIALLNLTDATKKNTFLPTLKILPNRPLNGWAAHYKTKPATPPLKLSLSIAKKMACWIFTPLRIRKQ